MTETPKAKPQFGTWTEVKYPPPIGVSVIVCREGQGVSFEAHRTKRQEYQPDSYPGVFWTNAVWNGKPIEGITHWMPMPPAKGCKN